MDIIAAVNSYYSSELITEPIIAVPDDGIIPLAYTTYEFGDSITRDIQVSYDTNNQCYLNYIDGNLVLTEPKPLEDFIAEIVDCTFDDIIFCCIDKGFEIFAGGES